VIQFKLTNKTVEDIFFVAALGNFNVTH